MRVRGLRLLCALAVGAVLPSCDLGERAKGAGPETPTAPQAKAADDEQPARELSQAPLVAVRRELMGTWFELKVAGSSEAEALPPLEKAVAEIARLEDLLSEWRTSSEISQINTRAGDGKGYAVSPETAECLKAGLDIARISDGAFDPTWAAMRGIYRFEPGGDRVIPRQSDVEKARTLIDYQQLVVSEDPVTARLLRRGMAVGTGGIAKGYALDRAGEILQQAGLENYLLFAGGQVQVHGSRGDRPWRIGIQHPRSERDHVGFIELSDGSVSTSGDYEHYFVYEGKRYHHIVDPETGLPATRSIAVTLVAPKGITADALSTACFIKGPKDCFTMLQRLPERAHAVVIDPDLRVHISPGFEDRVTFTPPLGADRRLHPPAGH